MSTYLTRPKPNFVLEYIALLNEMDKQGYEVEKTIPQFIDDIEGEYPSSYLIFRKKDPL